MHLVTDVPFFNPCIFNPRRACAARVTVVGLSVCPLVNISRLEHLFVLKTLSHTQRATNVKMIGGITLKPLHCRDSALQHCTAIRAVGHFYFAENTHVHYSTTHVLSCLRVSSAAHVASYRS